MKKFAFTLVFEVPDGVSISVHASDPIRVSQPSADTGPDVDSLLAGFERTNTTSRARELCERLISMGWDASPPEPRNSGDVGPYHYILLTYRDSASLYLGSRKLVSARKDQRPVVSDLPGAEPHKRSDIHFRHVSFGECEQAFAAAEAVRRWVDESEEGA